jgi:hypothetical protein
MGRFALTTVLSAIAFSLLLPFIPGFEFHGGIVVATALALITSGTAFLAKAVGRAATLTMRIRTIAPATVVLTPMWLIGVWLLPALELNFFASLWPNMLTLSSAWAVVLAAGVLLFINAATNDWSVTLKKPCECD